MQMVKKFSWRCSLTRLLLLRMYRVLGESDLTVKKFEKLISKRLVNHYKVEQLLPDYLELLRQVEVTRDHKVS
jgi:hypothetical protein